MKIIDEKNIEKTKQIIRESTHPIIILGQEDNYNRKLLEYGNFDILLSPEAKTENDKLKQMNSGINNVTAKIAVKNRVEFGLNLKEIKNLEKTNKAKRLAKIRQNIKICRKAKATIRVLNSESKEQTRAFLLSMGASTTQIKQSFD